MWALKTGILVILLLCNKLSHNTHLLSQNCIDQKSCVMWLSSLLSITGYNQGANWTEFSSGDSGWNSTSKSILAVCRVYFFTAMGWIPLFLCWLSVRGCFQLLEATYIPCHVVSCIFKSVRTHWIPLMLWTSNWFPLLGLVVESSLFYLFFLLCHTT